MYNYITKQLTAASILAGEKSFGSDNIDMTDIIICSTPRIGRQRSIADSYEYIYSTSIYTVWVYIQHEYIYSMSIYIQHGYIYSMGIYTAWVYI